MVRVVAFCLVLISLTDVIYAIISGEETNISTFPYMGSLQCHELQPGHICNTFLIKWDTIVTAAHCLTNGTSNPPEMMNLIDYRLFVIMGAKNYSDQTEIGWKMRLITEIMWHPQFEYTTDQYLMAKFDIGAAVLESPMSESAFINLIQMIPPSHTPKEYLEHGDAWVCKLAGWGSTSVSSDASKKLNYSPILYSVNYDMINRYLCCHRRMVFKTCMKMLGYSQSGTSCFENPPNKDFFSIGVGDEGAALVCDIPGCTVVDHFGCLAGMVVGGKLQINSQGVEIINPGFRIMEGIIQDFLISVVGHPLGLGGRTALEFFDYPYIGSLNTREKNAMLKSDEPMTHICNVVFVTEKAAITAAHCLIVDLCILPRELIPAGRKNFWITTGFSWMITMQRTRVNKSVLHQNATLTNENRPFYNYFDIGAVIMNRPFKVGKDFAPIKLNTEEAEYIQSNIMPYELDECDIVSWAGTANAYFGTVTDTLRDSDTPVLATVTLLPYAICCEIFFPPMLVQCLDYLRTSGHECHIMQKAQEAFLGDAGAPLVCYYKSKTAVMGIVVGDYSSFRCAFNTTLHFCQDYRTPAVHVDYRTMSDFIKKVLTRKDATGCTPRNICSEALIIITVIAWIKFQ